PFPAPGGQNACMARVLLGITGGIAAYKAAELARLLVKAGHEVTPILTPEAETFIAAKTFEALARREAPRELYPHLVHADLLAVAPLSANTLAKLAHGLADNVLTQTVLAFDGPVLAAPAMNPRMWAHRATRENVAKLRERGIVLVGPDEGELAEGGWAGAGGARQGGGRRRRDGGRGRRLPPGGAERREAAEARRAVGRDARADERRSRAARRQEVARPGAGRLCRRPGRDGPRAGAREAGGKEVRPHRLQRRLKRRHRFRRERERGRAGHRSGGAADPEGAEGANCNRDPRRGREAGGEVGAPSSNTCRLLARNRAAPLHAPPVDKAVGRARKRVGPLAS